MTPIDWAVLCAWLVLLVGFGIYRGRGSDSVSKFLLAGKEMPWYAMGLSIMATQASAITFVPPPGRPTSTACASCSSISGCRSPWC